MANNKRVLSLFHLIGVVFFVTGLLIRLAAIKSIFLTENEALFLFHLKNADPLSSSSFLYQVIQKVLFFLFGGHFIYARIPNAVIGSLIILVPFLFEKELDKKQILLLSFFFVFDPFMIANSTLLISHNLSLIFTGFFIWTIFRQRWMASIFLVFAILLSGFGSGYFLIFVLLLFLFIKQSNQIKIFEIIERIKLELNRKNKKQVLFPFLFIIIIVSFLTRVHLTTFINSPMNFIEGWFIDYLLGNMPILYPIVLLSYIPMGILFFMIGLIRNIGKNDVIHFYLALWILISTLTITFFPGHLFIDIVWISIPVWVVAARFVSRTQLIETLLKRVNIYGLIGIIVLLTSIFFTLSSLINKISYQANVLDEILLIVVLMMIIILLMGYMSYQTSLQNTLKIAFASLLVIGVVFQASTAMRVSGVTEKPESEVLWNGYYKDGDLIIGLIEQQRSQNLGTKGNLNVAFLEFESAATEWILVQNSINHDNVYGIGKNAWHVIFSGEEQVTGQGEAYAGQRFIINSYPNWLREPSGIFTADFWRWFFYRQGQAYNEYGLFWSLIKPG